MTSERRSPETPAVEVVVHSRDRLGETPLWCDRTRKLWWVDIENPRLQSFDPATGRHDAVPFDCDWLGSAALTGSGALLVAKDLGLHLHDPETGETRAVTEVETGLDNRLNDGRVDAAGRLWIGTMDNQLNRPNGGLYRVDPGGAVTRMFGDVIVSNGIAIAPDQRTLWFTDTRRYTTWAFDLDPDDGALSNRRVFADYTATGDRPDGACVDADGCLWQAFFSGGRIARYAPDGRIDREFAVPVTNPTCICFGGADLRTLYITTAWKFLGEDQLAAEPLAGALLAIDGIGQGLPENRFGM